MFSATILRPLTSARNYATIADRKNKFGGVISEYIFRNNRARESIRTPIFHRGSYAHRLAQRRGLSAGCALDGFVGGKGFCPFSAPCFAASARDLRGMPDFSPSPHVTQKTRARRAFLRGAEKRIRTSGRVTPVTRFPIVLLKPLRHLCK